MADKYRVAICEETHREVVQVWLPGENDWLCLHNEDPLLDEVEVEQFKQHQIEFNKRKE